MPSRLLIAAALAGATISCGRPSQHQPLYAAGSEKDEGHGLLARASSNLLTSDETATESLPSRTSARRTFDDEAGGGEQFGGDQYGGGGMFGNNAYGGATYAAYVPPPWPYPAVNRQPRYQQQVGLTAAIEGTITWRGPIPKVTTSCGTLDPLSISRERAVAGILVYIERVTTGRVLASAIGEQRPSLVGGVIVKRGCALAPLVQVVNPLPAQLAIHGDAKRTRLKITTPGATSPSSIELQEAGRVALQLKTGVTRVESDDATIGAAWVVGVDSPYYAITDDTGRFRIDELAAGTYDVTIFQPPVPTVANGKLSYGAPVIVHRNVRVTSGTSRLDVALGK
ncbi:MAG: hypothetical protein H0T46_16555 [Deltaproteobacteria bacterium]|nr:hypothetical protein [Deltaproteobacteria bacterium]